MIRSVENAEHYTWGQGCDGWHLLKSPGLSVIRERMPPGTSEQLHFHHNAQQMFCIEEGTASFTVRGKNISVGPGQSLHIPPHTLHLIANKGKDDLHFLVISQPASHGDRVDIISYTEEHKAAIGILNREWLEKYFRVEPIDEVMLNDPGKEIIAKGGQIFYARYNHEIVGTASLLVCDHGEHELGKMAVTEKAQGMGIGAALLEHCIQVAEKEKIGKLVLYSNRKLEPALRLYKRYGFEEVPMEPGHYERADIKMERNS